PAQTGRAPDRRARMDSLSRRVRRGPREYPHRRAQSRCAKPDPRCSFAPSARECGERVQWYLSLGPSVKAPYAIADVFDIVVADRHVHGQHQHALEESFGIGQLFRKSEGVMTVDRLATQLQQRSNAVVGELGFQLIAM